MNAGISPTTIGYHCNGACWNELNGPLGLIKFLEAKSPKIRDWFAHGVWATDENLRDHVLPALEDIHPIQDYVVLDTVSRYQNEGLELASPSQNFYETHPTLFKWENKFFIFQGTHRLTALSLDSHSTFHGWLLDLDSL